MSAIGLKYLELEKGTSLRKLNAGATIPTSQTREPVNIEELFNMFDAKTRTAIKINTNNFGDGLASRGLGLNKTISELRPVVNNAIPVLANLASPETDFRGFFKGLAARLRSRPLRSPKQQATQYVYLDTFFTAWAGVAKQLEEATAGRSEIARTGDPLAAQPGAADRTTRPSSCTCCARRRPTSSRSRRRWRTPSRKARPTSPLRPS